MASTYEQWWSNAMCEMIFSLRKKSKYHTSFSVFRPRFSVSLRTRYSHDHFTTCAREYRTESSSIILHIIISLSDMNQIVAFLTHLFFFKCDSSHSFLHFVKIFLLISFSYHNPSCSIFCNNISYSHPHFPLPVLSFFFFY